MMGRVDFDRYRSALAYCKNLIPLTQGPLTRRPGTYFCDEVKDSTKATRVVGFKFSTTQAYAIEFGDQYVRFKKNHAPIYDLTLTMTGISQANPPVVTFAPTYDLTLTITGISQANPGVVTYTGTDPVNGEYVDLSAVVGMTQVNGNRYKIANVNGGANTFELQTILGVNVDTTAYTAYSSGGVAKRLSLTTLANGDHVDVSGVVGMVEVNARRFTVASLNAPATTFALHTVDGVAVDGTAFTAYTSGGTASRVYTLTTTYLTVDLFELKFVQSADVLYIFHVDYPSRSLVRTSDAVWTLSSLVFLDGPYLPLNVTTTTLTPSASAPGAGVTLTASAVTGINNDTGFQTTDVGRYIRMQQGSVWGYVLITARTSTTVVTVTIINTLTSTAAKVNWKLGLWSDTTGYPAAGTFFGDRLYTGGTPIRPERIDGSKVGDYLNMATTDTVGVVTDESAVSFNLNSDDVQTIRWLKGTANGVVVGTFEGEWLVSPSALGEAITPTNINAKQSTSNGSTDTQPVKVGNAVLHISAGGRELYELTYGFNDNALEAVDMTILAEHITKGATDALSGMKEIAYQKKRTKVVWAVRNDGALLGFSYSRADKVTGWHRHELGGYANAGHTQAAKVESVAVIPTSDGLRDEVWLVVQRYINGRVVRYNEFMTRLWEHGDAQEDAFFADAGLTYDGAATTTIRGLYHLAGESVAVMNDGKAHPNRTVSALGVVTLAESSFVVQLGNGYNSDAQMLRPEAGAAKGTAQGKTMRTHRVFFRLLDTLGMSVGANFESTGYGKLTPIVFRLTSDPMGVMVPLFTGDKGDFSWEGAYTTENYVCLRFNQLFPGTLLAVMPSLDTQDY